MKRDQETGISILIVGGGIAGITFAIEAHRKGHNVRVLERRPRVEPFGKSMAYDDQAPLPCRLDISHLR